MDANGSSLGAPDSAIVNGKESSISSGVTGQNAFGVLITGAASVTLTGPSGSLEKDADHSNELEQAAREKRAGIFNPSAFKGRHLCEVCLS
jgi:hypothetical protein